MNPEHNQWRAFLSWLSVAALFGLCGVLGFLQYRWIDAVSVAARDRLRGALQAGLNRLSRDLDSEISAACRAVLPVSPDSGAAATEAELASRYDRWKRVSRHQGLFRRIAIVVPEDGGVRLRALDLQTGSFHAAAWPAEWSNVHERLESRLSAEPWRGLNPPVPAPREDTLVFDLGQFGMLGMGPPPRPFGPRRAGWALFDLNLQYVANAMLPELIQQDLGSGGSLDYQVVVLTRGNPASVIYQSDPGSATPVVAGADASTGLLEPRFDRMGVRAGLPAPPDRGPGRGPAPDMGRWQMFVRNRAGSLDAVVAQTRRRNLAVTGGVLLLMVVSAASLIRSTRRAQRLAGLQMDFVASVSHELRTPLAVIHTAAYNLQGRLAANPAQVERYGALIQQESGRLKDLVEQVLRFAGANAGHVIQEKEPLSVESLIADSVESSHMVIEASKCVVEQNIEPGLPLVAGDPIALQQAMQNLLSNAAKYGTEGSHWIGIFASKTRYKELDAVEIRVADRGMGIPAEEQEHIFDPFFRGKRPVQDQIHGTGLGLSLVKKIVEAHGGSIAVRSEPSRGTEFVIRIPAAPPQLQDEFAHSVSRG
jgi:signal transduction histidine kinase